jgi:hypothetical protein
MEVTRVVEVERVVERVIVEDAQVNTDSWIKAADELLAVGGLQEYERAFVEDMKQRLEFNPNFDPSEKQTNWFVMLYRRHVQRRKERVA